MPWPTCETRPVSELDRAALADLAGITVGSLSGFLRTSRRKVEAGDTLDPTDAPLPTRVLAGRPYWAREIGAAWVDARAAAGVVGRGGNRGGGRPAKSDDAVTVKLIVEHRGRRAQVTEVNDGPGDPARRAEAAARGLARQAGDLVRERLAD